MGIQEAIAQSREQQTIFIVKEALFCTVYEESAWRFAEFLKPYKAVRKRVKKLNMEVVSIGFPKSQLPAIIEISSQEGFSMDREEQGFLVIRTLKEPDLEYSTWKAGRPGTAMKPGKKRSQREYEISDELFTIMKEVESFSIADHTPIQSMHFVVDLQHKIKLVKKTPE